VGAAGTMAGLDVLSMLPMGGAAGKGAAVAAMHLIPALERKGGAKALQAIPELAERYPELGAKVLKSKETEKPIAGLTEEEGQKLVKEGKAFWSKGKSAESKQVAKMRDAAQKAIDAGDYKPYFDVAKRKDVDPGKYRGYSSTIGQVPTKVTEKIDVPAKYKAITEHPEATRRLEEAFERGKKMPGAENWYFMQQLEQEFIKELGPIEGRKQFDSKFASPMAAMTGGADPTDNLVMAAYGNWMREKGLPVPEKGYEVPYPVGGRFLGGNLEQYNKYVREGITPETSKRWNFRWNFLGQKGPTIDEQMMRLFDPKGPKMPEFYGPYQNALEQLAAKHGVDPRYFQEVAWAGLKSMGGGYERGKPMIQIVNEAIERTSRITGVAPAEVVKRALIYGQMPLYGTVGVVAADKVAEQITARMQKDQEM
jgi:hypothetical protein